MEFDHLKGFYYVAKLGSFTEAAGRLYVTQPAISLQVKALERELGERLFDRIGRRIRLTHAGELLYRHVEELIGKLDEIHRTVTEIKNLEIGHLHLGASDTTSMYFLPDLLKAFLKLHTGIDLRIASWISAEVIQRVLDREIDLGIVTLSKLPAPLEAIPLFHQKFVCITSPEHRLAARKVVHLKEISREPLIMLEKESVTRQRIEEYFQKEECSTHPLLELSNFEIIKKYVAAGLGVSILPEAAVDAGRDGVGVVGLQKPLSVKVGVIRRRDRELSRAARAFLGMAEEFFGSPRPTPRRVLVPDAN